KPKDAWKIIHRILSPNPKPLRVEPDELTTTGILKGSVSAYLRGHNTTTVMLAMRDDIYRE
ncbi:Hypothetical predicted protein, partial [Paramuricea clavata]